jgi:hypothetical protein
MLRGGIYDMNAHLVKLAVKQVNTINRDYFND